MRTKSLKKNVINVITLGCSKNLFDSEVLMGQLQANKKNVVHQKKGNIVVVNTCGFIKNAKEESINVILEQIENKKKGEIDQIFVTGCLSERYKSDLEREMPEVDAYFGTTNLPELIKVLEADYKHELLGERLITTPKSYAYLKVSEGCDRPCSFCAIPIMRGNHRSFSIDELVDQSKRLAKQGIKEIILIAQDLTYYGIDNYGERKLADLLRALVKVKGIEWIRLHYAFPTGFPLEIIHVMKEEPKICNYLDIPLQHASNKILKSMRRGTNEKKMTDLIFSIRSILPEIAIRSTFILGYPGETKEDFEILKKWVKKIRFERLGCFTYSHEENTHSYNLNDDVPLEIKQKRANEIMNIQSQISWELNQQKINKIYKCIVDSKRGDYFVARTSFDSPDVDNEVLIDAKKFYLKTGEFVSVKIVKAYDFDLHGVPVSL
ncbi:MAG: 30S ribosomal protein S12 methylthiotransferase RimO [Flavobacteriaceae bacterium]|nr:30S ribosomal protein S12 methylthiotransferase RimO [Flavobacteriaceae bacterium]|tara:strand:- start:14251 stop:15558 length:1308 start_codon:yes stop_codon:yes gene_type:complete